MKTMKIMLLMAISLSIAKLSTAQQINLTLKDALQYAIKNNENIKKAKLDIDGGRYKTEEVRAQALPQLNANSSLAYNPILGQIVFGDQSIQIGRRWNAQAGLQVDQQIFNQQVFTGLKAAKSSEQYYELNANLTEEQIIEQVANNYYQILVNKQQLYVIDTNIKNVKVVEKIIKNQYANGLAKKIDVDRIQVNLTNLYTQREQFANTITQLENQLKYAMGMPVKTAITLPQEELQEVVKIPFLTDTVDVSGRTELRLLNVQKDLLGLQRKAYQSEYYPTLSLTGNYNYTSQSDKFDFFKSGEKQAIGFDASAIGLTLRIPIFNGFATRSRIKQAEIDIQKAEEDRKQTQNALNADYENAKIKLRNSVNTINSQKQNVALAREIYTSTQNNYNNGLASLTDLLDTENALTEAQNSYNQALLNYKIAEIQLIKSNGNIKTLLN
ncbi:TolC family protein [Pedobacter glucosidilyticus]|uniref:TolC family protein n=1 Tax=Pedobacter glucosidilyticus TaxID=1122941 RepID=UPI00047C2C8D|nr:TolC family protein [Pedobacter glucosidilyticus]